CWARRALLDLRDVVGAPGDRAGAGEPGADDPSACARRAAARALRARGEAAEPDPGARADGRRARGRPRAERRAGGGARGAPPGGGGSLARSWPHAAWTRGISSDGRPLPARDGPAPGARAGAGKERTPEAHGHDARLRAKERLGVEAMREAEAEAVKREDVSRREPTVEDNVEHEVHRPAREIAREPRRVEPPREHREGQEQLVGVQRKDRAPSAALRVVA